MQVVTRLGVQPIVHAPFDRGYVEVNLQGRSHARVRAGVEPRGILNPSGKTIIEVSRPSDNLIETSRGRSPGLLQRRRPRLRATLIRGKGFPRLGTLLLLSLTS